MVGREVLLCAEALYLVALLVAALPVNALVIDQLNPDTEYVANGIGIFRTRDEGQSWGNYNDGFLFFDVPRMIGTGLTLHRRNYTLYASTMWRGAYRRYLG